MRRRAFVLGVGAALAASPALAQPVEADKSLAPLGRFLGRWRGEGDGEPGKSTVERRYEVVPGGRFIACRNISTYAPQPKNPKGERHEDLGFFSFDTARKVLVLRQFHLTEAFVNQYACASVGDPLVFDSEALENVPAGWRARETYRFEGADAFEELFELAQPGKPWSVYSRNRLKRA